MTMTTIFMMSIPLYVATTAAEGQTNGEPAEASLLDAMNGWWRSSNAVRKSLNTIYINGTT